MSFFTYLYQLKASFTKFLSSNKAVATTQEQTKYAQEVNANFNSNLKLKCKKAAQEIQYIKSFTHWPIAEAKNKTEKNAIVYLDISRNKLATITQKNPHKNKEIEAIDKTSLANKIVIIKKLP